MLFRYMIVTTIIFAVGLFPSAVFAEDTTVKKEEIPVFTNQDIEKYKKPSDSKPPVTKIDKTVEKRERLQRIKEEQEGEYWCKKATDYKRRIERAQDEVEEVEKELSKLQNIEPLTSTKKKRATEKRIKELQKKLGRERKQLRYAERDLSDLEDEAHRKEIPPGWLRCQFE